MNKPTEQEVEKMRHALAAHDVDELLQDLYSKWLENINNSKRYKVR